jgi:hypothetical protein
LNPVKVVVSGNVSTTKINPYTWKKLLSIVGPSGGTVYWRVIGKLGGSMFLRFSEFDFA